MSSCTRSGAVVNGSFLVPFLPSLSCVHVKSHPKVAAYRTVILSEAAPNQPPAFYVNGLLYPENTPETIFQTVLGTVEEWLVAVSNDPATFLEPHVYHLHTNAFVVTGTWVGQE